MPPPRRILVVVEPGRAAVAAVELARKLSEQEGATVTVIAIAPKAPAMRGCGPSAAAFNAAVCDSAASDLERAEELLWSIGPRSESRLLVEGRDPPLEKFVAAERFDLVLLPARRRLLRVSKHPAAASVARTGTEVRIVGTR
jgi:nucleotide-binding universal stress UspA family protein